jgi:hypothetical protein
MAVAQRPAEDAQHAGDTAASDVGGALPIFVLQRLSFIGRGLLAKGRTTAPTLRGNIQNFLTAVSSTQEIEWRLDPTAK